MKFPTLHESFLARRMTHPGQGPLPVILDSDTANEIDDPFALTWAVLSQEAIDLQAVHLYTSAIHIDLFRKLATPR